MARRTQTPIGKTGVSSTASKEAASSIVSTEIFNKTIQVLKNESAKELQKFSAQIAEASKRATEAELKYERRIEKLEADQNRVIETIGIFAALLAFVAFEAQIFKGPLSTASLVGVSSIIFGALVVFVLLLDMAFDAFKMRRDLRIGLFLIAFFCVFIGFISAYIGYKNLDHKEYYTKEQVDGKIENLNNNADQNIVQKNTDDNASSELLEFKNCILKQGLYKCL